MERFNPNLMLTTSETAELLAVHASTVKRWCNDGELPSEKTQGGHRRVHLEEAVAFARTQGIHTVLTPFHPYEPHVWSALQEVRSRGTFRRLHTLAMGWLARGDMRRLRALFEAVARDPAVPFCRFCDQGVRGFMVQVGEAWAQGRLRIADEHLVTQVLTEVLLKLRADEREDAVQASVAADRPVAVVGTMEGNQHQVGSLCVRLLLERLGWEVYYLGADVPVEEFAVIQRGRDATLVCVSMPPGAQRGNVARALRILTEFHDPSSPYALALGGGVPDGVGSLEGPFAAGRAFASCEELREALLDGFAPTLQHGALR